MANENIRHRSTTGTRLTPKWVIDLCIKVMGGIDLDPTSEPGPPFNVPAAVHWTKEDDCLAQPEWFGRVFMNPPYGKKRGVDLFLKKCRGEYWDGKVKQACILLPVDTSTKWWRILGDHFPWCGFYKRIAFDGLETGAGYPSAMFYLGPIQEVFISVFGKVGQIYQPVARGVL